MMTNTVKSVFLSWLEKRESIATSSQGLDYELEENLLGAARFVKDIALVSDDMELLGLATKVEGQQKELLEFLYNPPLHFDEDLGKSQQKENEMRDYCIEVFYKQERYSIDMEAFSKVVEENKDALEKVCNYKTLQNYISPRTALDKVYNAVKHKLWEEHLEHELTLELLDELVEYEKSEVYRKAKKHITNKLNLIQDT